MAECLVRLSHEKYLTVCGEIEKTVAAIYEYWSNCAEFDEVAQELWKLMRSEELDHFSQIEMLKRLTRGETIGDHALSDEHVLKLADHARNCLRDIKERPLTLQEALSMAISLEDTFMEFHAKQAFVCMDKNLEKMFGNLSRNDMEHADRLKEVYRQRFGSEPPICAPM